MSLNTHPSQWVNMARVDKLLEDVLDISLDDEEMFWEKEFRYEEYDNSIGDTKLNSQRIDDHDYLMDPQDVCSRKFGSYVAMYNLSSSAKTVEGFLAEEMSSSDLVQEIIKDMFHVSNEPDSEYSLKHIVQHYLQSYCLLVKEENGVAKEVVFISTRRGHQERGLRKITVSIALAKKDLSEILIDLAKYKKYIASVLIEPPTKPETDYEIDFTSWDPQYGEVDNTEHIVTAPVWDKIKINYTKNVQESLEHLFSFNEATKPKGRLIIWHGPPGTGKTWALRLLGYMWKEWAKISYVLDVESLFSNPLYLRQVFLRTEKDDPWRILVLEDCEEYFRKEAKEQMGQGASRLLNVADGFLGETSKTIILASTNANINEFHEAVSRSGRCLQQLEFPKLTAVESNEWLAAHGMDSDIKTTTSLADLYGKLEAHNPNFNPEKPALHTGAYL